MAERKNGFAVSGLGAFGSTVATELAKFDAYVLGIDRDAKPVARMADVLAAATVGPAPEAKSAGSTPSGGR